MGLGPIAPLVTVSPSPKIPPLPEKETVLVFTSGNGIEAFTGLTDDRHWPVITVGDETARLARSAGFKSVSSAKGTSEDITRLIMDKLPITRPIIHCAGNHVRGSITQDLQAAGFNARRGVYYQSAPVQRLPKIEVSSLTYIALYSPLAAQTLADFRPDLRHATAISMSPATDKALGGLKFKARLIAKHPTEAAMLTLIEQPRTG